MPTMPISSLSSLCHPNLDAIIRQLEADGSLVSTLIFHNCPKLTSKKCHLMIFGGNYTKATVTIGKSKIIECQYENLLGVTFDKKLNF